MTRSHGASHVVPVQVYLLVFGTLMVLTLTTIGVAYVDLGRFNIVAALTIAVIKATLVVLYFMHLRYSTPLTRLFAGVGFVWLLILVSITLSDFLTRQWIPAPRGW